jgi:hypothetical protein
MMRVSMAAHNTPRGLFALLIMLYANWQQTYSCRQPPLPDPIARSNPGTRRRPISKSQKQVTTDP